MPFQTVKLNDGNEIPSIAFGTGTALYGRDATDDVGQALETGFSHIDAAQTYENEASVGVAIRESGLARSEIYVTTKYGSGPIQSAVKESLAKLGLQYLDLYLVHNPRFVNPTDYDWSEFEKIKEDGLAKSIGVSNFNLEQLQKLVKIAKIKPAVNQIKFHPYNYAENKELLEYAAKHGIIIEGYSGLTPITHLPGGPVDKVVAGTAKRRGVTPAQIVLAWMRAKNVVIVTTSSKKERLEEYLAVSDISLTEDEVAAIDAAGAQGPPNSSTLEITWVGPLICIIYVVYSLHFFQN